MKITHVEEDGKKYVYDENFLTGKKIINVDGLDAQKVGKKDFILPDGTNATIKGSFIIGVKLILNDGNEIVICENKPADNVLIFLPLLSIIFGIFCGAIGGGLSGLICFLAACLSATVVRAKYPTTTKVICSIGITLLAFVAWFSIYSIIVVAFNLG